MHSPLFRRDIPIILVFALGIYIKVSFKEKQRAITKGQSVVFYDNEVVVGGGIIETVI